MKLYYFSPNNHDTEYFVVADNKIEAHVNLLEYFEKKIIKDICYLKHYKSELELWSKVNPLDDTSFPQEYTLDEYENNSVIESEIC